jgi:hypothetical protein
MRLSYPIVFDFKVATLPACPFDGEHATVVLLVARSYSSSRGRKHLPMLSSVSDPGSTDPATILWDPPVTVFEEWEYAKYPQEVSLPHLSRAAASRVRIRDLNTAPPTPDRSGSLRDTLAQSPQLDQARSPELILTNWFYHLIKERQLSASSVRCRQCGALSVRHYPWA